MTAPAKEDFDNVPGEPGDDWPEFDVNFFSTEVFHDEPSELRKWDSAVRRGATVPFVAGTTEEKEKILLEWKSKYAIRMAKIKPVEKKRATEDSSADVSASIYVWFT
jgi:hypothetical protein